MEKLIHDTDGLISREVEMQTRSVYLSLEELSAHENS